VEACHGDVIVKIATEFIQHLRENKIPKEYLLPNQNLQPSAKTEKIQENINFPNQKSTMNPVELPYITVSLSGIKPSEESRLIVVKVADPDVGECTISLFLTAGAVPGSVVHTQFGEGATGKEYNDQKHNIHEQNKVTARQSPIMAYLSNGSDSKGVCAQKIKLLAGTANLPVKVTQCPVDKNRVMAVASVPAPMTVTGTVVPATPAPSGFGGIMVPPTTGGNFPFPTMPTIPVGTAVSPPVSSGGPPANPPSGPGGVVPPPGSTPFEVVDIDSEKPMSEVMYQLPGGPRPIGFSAKSTQPYFYLLPGGVTIMKSKKKLFGAKDEQEPRALSLGASQKPKAEKARQISLQKYPLAQYPIGAPVAGAPTSGTRPATVAVTPQPAVPFPTTPSGLLPPPSIFPPFTPVTAQKPPTIQPPAPTPSLLPQPTLPVGFSMTTTPSIPPPVTTTGPLGGVTVTLPEEGESEEEEETPYSSENEESEGEDNEIINAQPMATVVPPPSLFPTFQPPTGQTPLLPMTTPSLVPPGTQPTVTTAPPGGFDIASILSSMQTKK
jgi:hypothetical protein